jgi:hypothetical protein
VLADDALVAKVDDDLVAHDGRRRHLFAVAGDDRAAL